MSQPWIWWWVGYTDRTKPVGQQALGAVVVKHPGPPPAVDLHIKALGAHPGGEALFATIAEHWGPPPKAYTNRLLRADEAKELAQAWDPGHGGLAGPDEIRAAFLDDDAQDGAPLFPRGAK